MAEKNELIEDSNELDGINLEPDTPDHELVVDNSENDYYSVDNKEDNTESINSDKIANEESDISDYALDDDLDSDKSIQKKRTKLQKILTIVLTILIILLTVGIILYFIGFFDEEKPAPKPIIKQEKVENKGFDFKSKDINTQRLNKKLNNLNKYDDEILKRKKEEEAKKKALEEKKRIELEEKKRKEEFEKAQKMIEEQKMLLEKEQQALESQKNELLVIKEKLLTEVEEKKAELSKLMEEKETLDSNTNMHEKMPNENMISMENNETDNMRTMEESKKTNSFLSFINVAILKNNLKKSFLEKIEKINNNIYLCRDNKNNIEIYVGPFEMNEHRSETLNRFINNGFKEAMQIDLTNEEFNKRCKY